MKPLEKIVNYFRIAPHGFIPMTVAAGLTADKVLNLGLYENLSPHLQKIDSLLRGGCIIWSCPHILGGVEKYIRFKKFVKEHGIKKNHVELNLEFYCERQAYKAAAYSCGFRGEFNEINQNFVGKKYCTSIPEI